MKARVHIMLKSGVLDPQGKAIGHALEMLGFDGVGDVRQGKVIDLDIDAADQTAARAKIEDMCNQLLANKVIENFDINFPE